MLLDVSKNWVILSPAPGIEAVDYLAGVFSCLRRGARLNPEKPEILDGREESAPAGAAEIVINWAPDSKKTSFAWRANEERVEIYGHCAKSLDDAIFDFTGALGVTAGGALPKGNGALYPLSKKAEFRF